MKNNTYYADYNKFEQVKSNSNALTFDELNVNDKIRFISCWNSDLYCDLKVISIDKEEGEVKCEVLFCSEGEEVGSIEVYSKEDIESNLVTLI